jgi:hypothetical protein
MSWRRGTHLNFAGHYELPSVAIKAPDPQSLWRNNDPHLSFFTRCQQSILLAEARWGSW